MTLREQNRSIFEDEKYGCPIYPAEYGSRCPATDRDCYYESCPIIYWMNVFGVIQFDKEGKRI